MAFSTLGELPNKIYNETKRVENAPKIDHEEAANDNEQDEVNKGEETVSIHHIVHDVDPALEWNDLEDCNPRVTDIVKANRALERVFWTRRAVRVVLIPVDTLVRSISTFIDLVLVVHVTTATPFKQVNGALALGVADSVGVKETTGTAEEALVTF